MADNSRTRFGCSFLVRALYVRIFQLGFCMAQRAYSCTLKKGYARNVCAFTNYDTLTCLTCVLTFSYYHWCHASTELCLFFCFFNLLRGVWIPDVQKHSFEFLIWPLKPFTILGEMQSKSSQNFMLINIQHPTTVTVVVSFVF